MKSTVSMQRRTVLKGGMAAASLLSGGVAAELAPDAASADTLPLPDQFNPHSSAFATAFRPTSIATISRTRSYRFS